MISTLSISEERKKVFFIEGSIIYIAKVIIYFGKIITFAGKLSIFVNYQDLATIL